VQNKVYFILIRSLASLFIRKKRFVPHFKIQSPCNSIPTPRPAQKTKIPHSSGQLRALLEKSEGRALPQLQSLVFPEWKFTPEQTEAVLDFIDDFNREYNTRRSVLSRRLDVTIGGEIESTTPDDPCSAGAWMLRLGVRGVSILH